MRRLKLIIAGILGTALAACVAVDAPRLSEAPTPMPLDHHNFNYALEHREQVQLIQAFDDGTRTFLQFTRSPAQPIRIEQSESREALAYRGDGPYLILPGVYGRLTVTVGDYSAQLINQETSLRTAPEAPVAAGESRPQNPPSDPPVEPVAPGSPAALRLRLEALVTAIEKSGSLGNPDAIVVRSDKGSCRVVIRFANNSSEVPVSGEERLALGEAAQSAERVILRGRTDASVATSTAGELALRRALAVKGILVAQGVEPQRVRILYRAAGDFEADDSTPEGRAVNRRVEIELRRGG